MGLFGKKYKCEACGAKFDSEAKLMEHSKTTHMQASAQQMSSFKCNTCGATFKSQAELMEHSTKAHPM
ncbi:MAG: C2H2-type zinc finger protein [Thaumarchaeota archaeon]|nr:C2H2-type zinc finger protein [Nitrososphaerota archaeon]MBI3115883.1 C2H2-type zinc finger protein [Nitrososphaerota archaeon]